MKYSLSVLLLFLGIFAFGQKIPEINKTEFSAKALAESITTLKGEKVSVKDVLEKHKGKILIIDFWASWCKDCLLALPKTKELKENNPEVEFVYFSLDRSEEQWKKGLEKHGLDTEENYWFQQGWKNEFNDYIDLNWVPRFIVVDQKGNIAKYYAIAPDDPKIQQTIDDLVKS